MFIVLLTYIVSLDVVDQMVVAHREFLDEQYRQGRIIFSGPKIPRTGGVILFKCKDRKELETILETDPFKRNGLAKYEVIEFNPTKSAVGFKSFINR